MMMINQETFIELVTESRKICQESKLLRLELKKRIDESRSTRQLLKTEIRERFTGVKAKKNGGGREPLIDERFRNLVFVEGVFSQVN